MFEEKVSTFILACLQTILRILEELICYLNKVGSSLALGIYGNLLQQCHILLLGGLRESDHGEFGITK